MEFAALLDHIAWLVVAILPSILSNTDSASTTVINNTAYRRCLEEAASSPAG